MINKSISRNLKRYSNKFTIVLVGSLLLTLLMTVPANSLLMVEYRLPLAAGGVDSRPRDIAAVEGDSKIVFTEQAGGRIGLIDTSTPDPLRIIEAILPPDPTAGTSEPWGIYKSGTDIWFTDYRQNKIGRMPDSFANVQEWAIPTASSGPRGIFFDPNRNDVWFTEALANKIGRLNPATNVFTEWNLPSPGSTPNDIIVVGGAYGMYAVYFTEYDGDRIGALDPVSNKLTEFKLQSGSRPWSLANDSSGMIWFTGSGRNVLGVLNPFTGNVTEHKSVPTGDSEPRGIAVDDLRGEIWFTEYADHKVSKYVPAENLFYEYPTNTGGSSPNDVALHRVGVSGRLDVLFTEYGSGMIGRITQGGPIDSFGTTSTTTVSTITSAVSGAYIAASSTTSTTAGSATAAVTAPAMTTTASTISDTNTVSSIRSDTAYRLSTSTFGTTTSYIVEVAYTSATSTEVTTSYITTTSVTSSTTFTSTSTSYIATTSVTSTSTSTVAFNTETVDRTSTSVISVPNTLSTILTDTKYKTTVAGTTSTTSTATSMVTLTQTSLTTIPTTVSGTTTSTRTTTTYTIPPFPELPGAIPGYPIESIMVGIGLAAIFLIIFSRRKRPR